MKVSKPTSSSPFIMDIQNTILAKYVTRCIVLLHLLVLISADYSLTNCEWLLASLAKPVS